MSCEDKPVNICETLRCCDNEPHRKPLRPGINLQSRVIVGHCVINRTVHLTPNTKNDRISPWSLAGICWLPKRSTMERRSVYTDTGARNKGLVNLIHRSARLNSEIQNCDSVLQFLRVCLCQLNPWVLLNHRGFFSLWWSSVITAPDGTRTAACQYSVPTGYTQFFFSTQVAHRNKCSPV